MAYLDLRTELDGTSLPCGGQVAGPAGTPHVQHGRRDHSPLRRAARAFALAALVSVMPAATAYWFFEMLESGTLATVGGGLGFLVIAPFLPGGAVPRSR